MIDILKSINNLLNIEASNIAGVNVKGYKKKEASLNSVGDNSVGNDVFVRTNFSQSSVSSTESNTDLAIQGEGFFILFDGSENPAIDPNEKFDKLNQENRLEPPITSGNFTINGASITIDVNNDSLNDVFAQINIATGGQITGTYDAIKNEVKLANKTGKEIEFGINPSTNFIESMRLDGADLQGVPTAGTFIVSNNPVGSSEKDPKIYLTRKGNFSFNDNGFLVNEKGLYIASIDSKTGNLIKTDKKTFDGKGDASDIVHISSTGIVYNDTHLAKEGKQIALAFVSNKNGLQGSSLGGDLYEIGGSSGDLIIDNPTNNGLGFIQSQSLEDSNSSIVESLTNMGILQKFFPSTVSAMKTLLSKQDDLNNLIK